MLLTSIFSFLIFFGQAYMWSPVTIHALTPAEQTPKASDDFVNAIGVDSHFNYKGTPYVTEFTKISAELVASGIRHIRDGGDPSDGAYMTRIAYLGQHGIKHSAGFNVNVTPDHIRSTLRAFAPYVDFIEPANEYDGQQKNDSDWIAHLIAEQQTLYTTVHGTPEFAAITVLGPALEHQSLYSGLGRLDDYEDAGNLHNTTCNQNPGTLKKFGLAPMETLVRASTIAKPIWTTETGYNDDTVRPCALPDDIIARYTPRTVAERFNAGEPRVYFYQLANMPGDRAFGGLGLIDEAGNPKPQFTALVSLIGMLADPGPTFALRPLRLTIDGSQDVHHTLLQKRDGTYELLLWRELSEWKSISANNIGGERVPVPSITVTVSAPDVRTATYYQYDNAWTFGRSAVPASTPGAFAVPVSGAISVLQLH